MTQLQWHETGQRFYETGVDRGVLYLPDNRAVAWSGLISVNEASSNSDSSANYVDGIKFMARHRPDSYSATVEAYSYPTEFEDYGFLGPAGPMTGRPTFNFTYRTRIANDLSGSNFAYKLHLVYNAFATPAQKQRKTFSSSIDPDTMSWDISTRPVKINGAAPSSHLIIDTTLARAAVVADLEELLYGTETSVAFLPQPNEVLDLFESHAILHITVNGDGTWTAEGPDDVVRMVSDDEFEIDWPSVVYINDTYYEVSSS